MKNFDDYMKAVRLKCEEEKSGKYGSYFLVPSPAQLRNLCLVLFDNKLDKIDEAIFRLFFKVKDGEDLRKAIENFDVVKFRAVKNFFTGKNEKTNMHTINLIAALVDYPSRPYNKFLKEDTEEVEKIQTQDKNTPVEEEHILTYTPQNNQQDVTPTKSRSKHKALIFFLIAISLVTGGYMAKDICFPTKQCMQWQEDHYEVVDCEVKRLGLVSISPVEPLNEDLLEFKKVKLKKGMEFFKYKKPLYYYYKVSRDSIEFFNAPGLHPVTKKPLNEISPYIIDKYVK